MNLINNYIITTIHNNIKFSSPVQLIDSVTYDQYEVNNPLRLNIYDKKEIHNKYLRSGSNIAKNIGTEVVSAYVNPFYVTHKIINTPPIAYKTVINAYSKAQNT